MTHRPILMSAPMVKALLAGSKTQTRRILKPQPRTFEIKGKECEVSLVHVHGEPLPRIATGRVLTEQTVRCAIGDRLWVRETWSSACELDDDDKPCTEMMTYYRADGEPFSRYLDPDTEEWRDGLKWRPSIYMPRHLSRLTLTVTEIRVERLQHISREDALAEGVEHESADPPFYYVPGIWPHNLTAVGIEEPGGRHAERSYAKLWNHINGARAWDANPWVVALTFTVERRNIDG